MQSYKHNLTLGYIEYFFVLCSLCNITIYHALVAHSFIMKYFSELSIKRRQHLPRFYKFLLGVAIFIGHKVAPELPNGSNLILGQIGSMVIN